MSFALDVKTEIFNIEIDEICCARAELAGMVCFGTFVGPDGIKLRSEHGIVAQRFYLLIKHIYNIDLDVKISENGVFSVAVTGDDAVKLLRDMKLATVPIRISREIIRNDCCKLAFVRGAFLGGGSVSDPEKSYHAEINTSHHTLCRDFDELLAIYDIFPKRINRNGNNVFYLKDSEQIEALLAVLGAHSHMMEFMNVKISKEMSNSRNRQANCETANMDKIYQTAVSQVLAITKIKEKIGFESLSPELKQMANTRLEHPTASLSEMAKIIGISKSGANHRMRKIMAIAEEL